MLERPTATNRPVERGLIIAFGLASLITAITITYDAILKFGWQTVAGLVLLGLAVALFGARYRVARTIRLALGLAVTVLLLGLLTTSTPTIIFLILVTQVVIAFDVGLGVAAAMSFVYAVTYAISGLSSGQVTIQNAILENALTALLLLLAAPLCSALLITRYIHTSVYVYIYTYCAQR